MTDSLIREAAALHIDLYITGQLRQPANKAVQETRMTIAIVGHATGELWGLRELASILSERWPDLTVLSPTLFGRAPYVERVGTTFMASVNSLRGILGTDPWKIPRVSFLRKGTHAHGFNGAQSPSMN